MKVVQILISITIIYFLIDLIDIQLLLKDFTQFSPYLLLLVFFVCVFDRVLMAVKWNMLLNGTVDEKITFYEAIKVYFISSFYGFFIPLGGVGPDVVRAVKIVRDHDIKTESILISIVVERLLGLVATAGTVIMGLSIFLYLLDWKGGSEYLFFFLVVIIFGIILILLLYFNPGLWYKLLAVTRLGKLKNSLKFKKYIQALERYKNKEKLLGKFLLLSAFEQFMPLLVFYFTSIAIAKEVSIIHCLAVVPIISVVVRLPISYAGIGVREASYAGLLAIFGYHYSDVISVSLVAFSIFVASLTIGGFISVFDHNKNRTSSA